MPRMFQVRGQIPGLNPQLRVKGVNAPQGQMNVPVMVRNAFAGMNMPDDYGDPGNAVYPYDERAVWGDGGTPGASPSTPYAPPATGQQPVPLTQQQASMPSTPYGQSDRPWRNPCTYAGFPLNLAVGSVLGVLNANFQRNSLIIQNTSTATLPDVAPTLYVAFNNQPGLTSGSLALPPGLGFYWGAADCPPRDNIAVVFLGGSGVFVIAGCVIQGTYVP